MQLEKLVSLAEGLKAEDFTKASFEKMSDALEVAQEILYDDDALEVEIQKSYDALNQALLALERLADKISLETVIAKAADVERNLNLYMIEGKEAFTKALAAARTIAADADASQGIVDQAATALADALANLRKLADKTQQEELLRERISAGIPRPVQPSLGQSAICSIRWSTVRRFLRKRHSLP